MRGISGIVQRKAHQLLGIVDKDRVLFAIRTKSLKPYMRVVGGLAFDLAGAEFKPTNSVQDVGGVDKAPSGRISSLELRRMMYRRQKNLAKRPSGIRKRTGGKRGAR